MPCVLLDEATDHAHIRAFFAHQDQRPAESAVVVYSDSKLTVARSVDRFEYYKWLQEARAWNTQQQCVTP